MTLRRLIGGLTFVCLLWTWRPAQTAQAPAEDDWTLPTWVQRTPNSGLYGGFNLPAGETTLKLATLTWRQLNPGDGVYNWSAMDALVAGPPFILRLYNTDVIHCPSWVKAKYPGLTAQRFHWPNAPYPDTLGNTSVGDFYPPWHAGFEAEFHKFLLAFKARNYGSSTKLRGWYIPGGWKWDEWSLKWVPEMTQQGFTPTQFLAWFTRLMTDYVSATNGHPGKLIYTGTPGKEWIEWTGSQATFDAWVAAINGTVSPQTTTARLAWDQTGPSLATVQRYAFTSYTDATPGRIVPATCSGPASPFTCSMPIPTLTLGKHTVSVTATNAAGESVRSSALAFTVAGTNAMAHAALQAGVGARDGSPEWFNYCTLAPDWGMTRTVIDGHTYMVTNDAHPFLNGTRFLGMELECFGTCGGTPADYYHVKMATLKALQLRANWVFLGNYTLAPGLFQYMLKTLGKRVSDSPDAWVALREARDTELSPSGPIVRNWERWLVQREVTPGGHTVAVSLTTSPAPQIGSSFEAVRTNQATGNNWIYFGVNDGFIHGGPVDVDLYVTYLDNTHARWRLAYDSTTLVYKPTLWIQNVADGRWKTVRFVLPDAGFTNRQAGGMDFRLYNGGAEDLTVRFVRVVKVTPP